MPLTREARTGRLVHVPLADPRVQRTLIPNPTLVGLGGAPVGASYVVLANNGTLTAERALAVSTDLSLADGGANGSVTLGLANAGPGATGPIGDASHVAAVTIDAKGRVTTLGSVAIALDHHANLSNFTANDDHTQYALLAGRAGGQTLYGGTAASENLVLHSTAHATKGALQLDDAVTFWPSTPTTGTTVTTWGPTLALNGVGQAVHKIAPTLTWTTPGTYFGLWFGGSMSVAVQPTNFNFHAALYADLASSSSTNGVIPWAPDLLLNAMTQTLSGAITASAPSSYISTDISSVATIKATGGATLNYNAAGSGLCSIYWASGVNADAGSTIHMGRLTAIWDKTVAGSGAGSVTIDAISSVYTKDKATFGGTVACIESEISAGAGKWCIYDTGGANSAFTGAVRIGDTTAPTQKLEVAGNGVITGTATVSGTTKMLSMPIAMTTTDNVLSLRMLDVSGTLTYNVANFLSLNTGISFKPSLVFTVAGSLPSFSTMLNGPTFTASGVAISGNSGAPGFKHAPAYNIAAGGSHTGIHDIGFQSSITLGASCTAVSAIGFLASDASVSGTLTTQVGVDIAALSTGGTNIGLRSAVAASANNYFLQDTGGAQSSFAGKFTKYNNVTLAGVGMTSVVAVIDQTAKTAAQSGVALWTPAAAGFYRVGVVLTLTTAGTTSTLGGAGGVKINYKTGDGATAKNQQVPMWIPGSTTATVINSATNTVGDTLIGSIDIYTDTTAVTFDCGYTSSGTAMQYSLHIRVEAL